jgi:hypothetical protein
MRTDDEMPPETPPAAEPIHITLVGSDDTIGAVVYPDRVHPDLLESLRLRQLLSETGVCECGAEVSLEDAVVVATWRIAQRHANTPVTRVAMPHLHFPDCLGHHRNLMRLLFANNCDVLLINNMFPERRYRLWPDSSLPT